MDNNTVSGLLINDISDHLPVFTVYNSNYTSKKENKPLFRRVRTVESMVALKDDLLSQDWEIIYQENDIDNAYEEFLRIFKLLYDKNCPIKKYCKKQKYNDRGFQKDYKMPVKKRIHSIGNLLNTEL